MATRPAYVYNGSGWDDIGDKRIGAAAGDIPQASVANLTSDLADKADASALTAHESDTTSVHGIADTSLLETTAGAQAKADAAQSAAEATAASALSAHNSATTSVHGIIATNSTTALGFNSAPSLVSGNDTFGANTLASNTSGYWNVAIGSNAAYHNTTGIRNTAIGQYALYTNTTGQQNVAVGGDALASGSTFTGNQNTAVGFGAMNSLVSGGNNTGIGQGAQPATSSSSNSVTLGNTWITSLRCAVQTISSLSDERDKTNIQPLDAGLDFVNALEPVRFDWNTRDEAKVGIPDIGFTAQQLVAAMDSTGMDVPGLVSQENPDKLEAAYGTLIPVLVQAIKDLSAEVQELKAQVAPTA